MNSLFQIGSVNVGLVDLIIFTVCMISAVFCCIRGFVAELSKWVGLAVGVLIGIMFTPNLRPVAEGLLPEGWPALAVTVVTFLTLLLAGFLVIVLLGSMLRKIVETFNLGLVDSILGFIWGLVISLLAFTVIVYLLGNQTLFDFGEIFQSSAIIQKIIMPFMPDTISALGTITEEGIRTFQHTGVQEAANVL